MIFFDSNKEIRRKTWLLIAVCADRIEHIAEEYGKNIFQIGNR